MGNFKNVEGVDIHTTNSVLLTLGGVELPRIR